MSSPGPLPKPVVGRLLFAALTLITLVGMFAFKWSHAGVAQGRRVGFSLIDTDRGLIIDDVVADYPAGRAGLLAGDRLLEIDGRPVRTERDYDSAALGFRHGDRVRMAVDRGGEKREAELVAGVPLPRFSLFLGLFVALAYAVVAVIAFGHAARDVRARLLTIFTLAVAIEEVLPFEPLNVLLVGMLSSAAFYLLTGIQMGLEVHMALLIPERPAWLERRRWVVPLVYSVGAAAAVVAVAALVVEYGGGRLPWTSSQAQFVLIEVGLPVWALLVAAILGERFRHHPRREGRQLAGLVLLGALPWVVVVWLQSLSLFLPVEPIDVPQAVWSLAILVYPVTLLFAIFRFHLFDIELVIRKSLLYGALTTTLVLIFYAALGAGGVLFARYVEGGTESVWVVAAATLALGLLFNPLRTRLQRLIDQRLFPESEAYRQRVLELVAELPGQGKLPRMGEYLCEELCKTFGLRSATIWISTPPLGQLISLAKSGTKGGDADLEQTVLLPPDDPGVKSLVRGAKPLSAGQLARASGPLAARLGEVGAEIAMPLLTHGRLGGVLLLGPKRSGERFGADELDLVKLLATQAATVFENARLFESATFEGLTGLYRREAVLEILDREWSRSVRYDRPLSIALADLDRFKWINDRCGHLVGDLVLQRVAAELKSQLRETDFIGRFGGEEFLLVLPETEQAGATHLAEKIRSRIEQLAIPLDDGEILKVTLSIGVASRADVRADGLTRARPLLSAADTALYSAKRAGRNRVEVAANSREALG